MESKKFKNKITGEIVTQVPISHISDYEEVKDPNKLVVRAVHIIGTGIGIVKGPEIKEYHKDQVIADLIKADAIIKRHHKYFCGIARDDDGKFIGSSSDIFFESPDGQNGELYYELKRLGYRNARFTAEYYWKVKKDNWIIEYVEGDIYIKNLFIKFILNILLHNLLLLTDHYQHH